MAASPNATDGAAIHTDGENDDENVVNGDVDVDVRIGTISSARFNILSTMVGGGCLSLPLAFQQSGNALIGPLMLLATGVVTEFCFRNLVASAVVLNRPHPTLPGRDTFESISNEAFGPKAYLLSMGLVVLMCFFGTVGYSVLLRDMMEPLNDAIAPKGLSGSEWSEWLHHNFTMFLVVVLVTPFCTLRRLTALKDCGAASMASLLVLGSCIVVRSVQCNLGKFDGDGNIDGELFWYSEDPWYTHLRLFPDSWQDLLNALPLYISCFVCHYNILPVHNELKDPSPARVSWWLRSTTWFAVALYMVMGFAGSAYAHCTPSGKIQGSKCVDCTIQIPCMCFRLEHSTFVTGSHFLDLTLPTCLSPPPPLRS
jgi:amino acid permease